MSVTIISVLALISLIPIYAGAGKVCDEFNQRSLSKRPHSVSITEFGAIGDGKTLNTLAFQNAAFYLMSFADKGGAQLYVPPGKWLTGSFSLTSHLTLYLANDAVIVASQDPSHWEVDEPLPSYGQGIDLPGKRYKSLINGYNLQDVVITGDNGSIDGQGLAWWDRLKSHSLKYSRPHLIELVNSDNIIISNLTFLNPPAYTIHSVYSSHVYIHKVSAYSSPDSPYTIGVVPDSSDNICIQNSNFNMGNDAISVKSGWDEYGISYSRPTKNIHIRNVHLQAASGSALSFGSEMSGGISDIIVESVTLQNSLTGVTFKTTKGRGGYIKTIDISNIKMERIGTAIVANGSSGFHPDDKYDENAYPLVTHIRIVNVSGESIEFAGRLVGIKESPFTSLTLRNVSLTMKSGSSGLWLCRYVYGSSESVVPEPCPELMRFDSGYSRVVV